MWSSKKVQSHPSGTSVARRRGRRATQALLAVCLTAVAAVLLAGPASAAATTSSQVVPVASNEASLGGFQLQAPIVIPDPLPIVLTNLTFTAKATWTGNITTKVGWNSDNVRQGAKLDVGRSAPLTDGKIHVEWQVSGEIDSISFGPTSISSDDVTCEPTFAGGSFSCEGSSMGFPLPGALPSFIPTTLIVAELAIGVKFDVTPEGAVVSRGFTAGGANISGPSANPGPLDLLTAQSTETFTMPCTAKAGDAVDYDLGDYHWTPDTTATQHVQVKIVNTLPGGIGEAFTFGTIDIGSAQVSSPNFDLTGPGFLTSMGSLLANNVTPTIDALGPFSGSEGAAIPLSATAVSQCPIASYVWEFSNGTKSFGPAPQRSFADNDVYDGQLTVTDVTGLSATQSFSVSVANVKPSVNAGPDTTSDWGRSVQFNGQATDPGSADQATLQYTWTFGDGSPSASGGPSVLHSYAMPGDYSATLEVCDKDGACDTDTRSIHVTKRDTVLGYTGVLLSSPSKVIGLAANVVDEYGQPVTGKKVTFVLGAQSATGTTDAAGHVSVDLKLTQKSGSYTFGATFAAGDPKYNGSADSGTFVIGK